MTTTTTHLRPIFVYGSLRKGLGNHHLLADTKFDGEGRTAPGFQLYDFGGFPGMVATGPHAVIGEIYLVDDHTLARLDRLESHPRWYCRTPIRLDNGREVEAYLLRPDQVTDYPAVRGDDWVNYVGERQAKDAGAVG